MKELNAKPRLLKQANLSLIRKIIKRKGTVTRAEIANETKISSTTIRSLLSEMIQNGEIESIGYDESSGGRKAERYRFRPDRYHGVAFCITENCVYSLLINICGEIERNISLEVCDGNFEQVIVSYLDQIICEREIKSIGIGVPGVVDGRSYWKKNISDDGLYRVDIGVNIAKKYGIPVVLENDLNATAIGFGRCYQREYPEENPENTNMVYLHFEKGCISSGLIVGGKIVRGANNFAGELGLIPMEDGKLLDECMPESMDDVQYTKTVIKIIAWICGILNPKYVALSGSNLRKDCIGPIGDGLSALLPKHMFAEILYAPDIWHDYFDGIAYLTANKMFDDIQFRKE